MEFIDGPPERIALKSWPQNDGIMALEVNFYNADELAKCITEGAKALGLEHRVWLTGSFGKIERNDYGNH